MEVPLRGPRLLRTGCKNRAVIYSHVFHRISRSLIRLACTNRPLSEFQCYAITIRESSKMIKSLFNRAFVVRVRTLASLN